ncbi:type II secretion system F family protein [Stratiformator vulcanicus]|uniref:Type II secretion system protein F n=1 Tax=Stratiformator vulcanicus TaxID=2527980 RepID=A0A517QWY4_9PLAN|nr:type II secretion system F family protein [Stratiformator vulcanicus]QDT36172.1 Type II secretion system protein F [Stratiformator vulcanicus]
MARDLSQLGDSQLRQIAALGRHLSARSKTQLPLQIDEDRSARLGAAGLRLFRALDQGISLPDALQKAGAPPLLKAVVEAGLSSGRLDEALEAVTETAADLLRVRRELSLACIYPAVTVVVAWGILMLIGSNWFHLLTQSFEDFDQPVPWFVQWGGWLCENPGGWLYWFPIGLVLLIFWLGGPGRVAMRFPGLSGPKREFRRSVFLKVAALLVEHDVALPRALRLAGNASGSGQLSSQAEKAALQLESGSAGGHWTEVLTGLSDYTRWLLFTGESRNQLGEMFADAAVSAQRRGRASLDWYCAIAPVVVSAVVCGAVVILYAWLFFGGFLSMLNAMLNSFR